jgi:hypothetical protein
MLAPSLLALVLLPLLGTVALVLGTVALVLGTVTLVLGTVALVLAVTLTTALLLLSPALRELKDGRPLRKDGGDVVSRLIVTIKGVNFSLPVLYMYSKIIIIENNKICLFFQFGLNVDIILIGDWNEFRILIDETFVNRRFVNVLGYIDFIRFIF